MDVCKQVYSSVDDLRGTLEFCADTDELERAKSLALKFGMKTKVKVIEARIRKLEKERLLRREEHPPRNDGGRR